MSCNGFPEASSDSDTGSGDTFQPAELSLLMKQSKERERVWVGGERCCLRMLKVRDSDISEMIF